MKDAARTDELIHTLARGLTPVQRLIPPALRALLWLAAIGALTALALLYFANPQLVAQRMAIPRIRTECIAVGLTGVAAVFAAFQLAVPGRSRAWAALPLPPALVWLAVSGLGCVRNGWSLHGPGGFVGDSPHCFVFIIAVSVPLSIMLFAMLRRARPIAPLPVALLGALGVAALSAFVLEFFHPFDVTVIDLVLHLAGFGVVIGAGALWRRRWLASEW